MSPASSKAVLWFRTAAGLGLLFALGHSVGFLAFRPPSADGRAVWEAMNRVHFSVGSSSFSYGGFYTGFGLSISAFQLFSAWLAWWLGTMTQRGVREARPIAWALCLLNGAGVVLAVRYFSYGPAVLSAVSVLALGLGARALQEIPGWSSQQRSVTVTTASPATGSFRREST